MKTHGFGEIHMQPHAEGVRTAKHNHIRNTGDASLTMAIPCRAAAVRTRWHGRRLPSSVLGRMAEPAAAVHAVFEVRAAPQLPAFRRAPAAWRSCTPAGHLWTGRYRNAPNADATLTQRSAADARAVA